MNLKKTLATWSLVASVTPLLAGCFGAVAVGAGAGVLMATDRRASEIYLGDEGAELRGSNRISEKFGDKVHVNLTSYNRMVLITGEVPSDAAKAEVEKIVGGLPNVKSVVNELQIAGPSALTARTNDGYITSKVKARFIDHNKFSPNVVKVVTEAGVVYLMGLVTQREADAAVDIARTTGGVLRVVRVFETPYLSESEAQRLDNKPANNAATKTAEPKVVKP